MTDEEESRRITAADLTLNEKLNLLTGDSLWSLPSVHGLPSLTLCDGPHGVRKQLRDRSFTASYAATCFPTAAALACAWDTDLIFDIGTALCRECDWYNIHVLLAPGMNLKRHPYGGRNFEYFSEDPILTAQLAAAYVRGVQHSGTTAACIKHFAVNNQESHRFVVNAVVDPRTLHEFYLDAFGYVVQHANPALVMTAYNQLNGKYCSEHEYLLKDFLRRTWNGVTVSDWGATNARIQGLMAGLDLEMPGSHGVHNAEFLKRLEDKTLEMRTIDASVDRILHLIHTYGSKPPHDPLVSEDQLFRDHFQLAKAAALESMVLLKNDSNLLPLDMETIHSVALIGQFGKDHPRYQGMGSSMVNSTKVKSIYTALREHFTVDQIHYAQGYHPDDESLDQDNVDTTLLQQAATAAQAADFVILCIGLPEIMESEGFDRTHLSIPAQHTALVDIACSNNTKVIVVLANGGVIELPWFDAPSAILETYLAGEAGGPAAVDMIFGKSTPCGKLAESWPLYASDLLADDCFPGSRDVVEYREGLCVGYRHLDTENVSVRFPFGFGLSYTNFAYQNVKVNVVQDEQTSKQVVVSLEVQNTGKFPGREIVQVYVRHTNPSVFRPTHELQGFAKTKLLPPGQTSELLSISLNKRAFSYYDTQSNQWIVEKSGTFEIQVAAHSRDIRHAATIQFAHGDDEPESKDGMYESFADRFECRDSVRSAIELRDDIHRNSLLKDVAGQSWLGSMLLSVVFHSAMKEVAPNSKNPEREKKLVEATVSNLPLRALVLFSKGAFTFDLLDACILLMNLRYFAAIVGFGRALYQATFGRLWKSTKRRH